MILKRLSRVFHRRPSIYYVSDQSNWAIYWVVYYLTEGLKRHAVNVRVIEQPWELRRQIIHFADRYTLLNGPMFDLHSSNRVFVTWFHGDPAEPVWRDLSDKLKAAQSFLERIVVSCRISYDQLVRAGIQPDKLCLISLGVDLQRFTYPSPEERRAARVTFGIPEQARCVGSFQKDGVGWGNGEEPKLIKGPDVFLQAVESLAHRHPNLFVLLTGPARGYVTNGLERLGIPFVHHYLENYHDLNRYYHALDLYLITSRAEGGPKSLLESWATGVPVISTRVGMPADLIRHGENGFLVDIEDVSGLVGHATAVIEDAALRDAVRERGREEAQNYSWQHIADRYFYALYAPFVQDGT